MRTRIRRAFAVAAVSALCLTAAACGDSDGEKKSVGESAGERATDQPKDAPEDQPKDEPKDGASDAEPLTAAQMKAATATAQDLPAGFTKSGSTANDERFTADKKECQPIVVFMGGAIDGATIGGNVDFEGDGGNSLFSQQVFTFSGGGAEDYTKAIGTALETCTAFSFTDEGDKTSVTVRKITAPKVGEESHAFRLKMTATGSPVTFEVDIVAARQGSGATRFVFVPGDAAGHKSFDDLVKRVGDRFVRGAGS
ncbi:hypothetical protein ACFYT4_00645 [Streptomyces sp. NPDC004609]|uniref:hypothetical protein n=1 Tax=Streptomyces sp. NPDC004609 TaxID=3364704 RepID=UPI00369FA718